MKLVHLGIVRATKVVAAGVLLGLAVFAAAGGFDGNDTARRPATPTVFSFNAPDLEDELHNAGGPRLTRSAPIDGDEERDWESLTGMSAFSIAQEEDSLES